MVNSRKKKGLKISLSLTILINLIGIYSFAQNRVPEYFEYEMLKITDSVYVFTRPMPFRVVQGNVTVIINKRDVIVVDGGGSPDAAKIIIKKIKKITSNPVRYLIITHWHGDHAFGNQEFVKEYPGIEIISSRFTRDYFVSPGLQYPVTFSQDKGFKEALDRLDNLIKEVEINKESGYEKVLENLNQKRNHDFYAIRGQYKKTIITMPTCVFEDRMTIYRGGREISLLSLGFGDTRGDVFVHLPKEKILITGDAVVNPVPYGFSSEPLEWIQTLKKASDLDADVIVPGHGKVQYNKQYLIKLIESLEAIQVKVKEAIDNGVKSEEIIDKIDLRNIEIEFTQQDPVLQFYFRLYFSKPLVTTLYDKLKSSALKQ